MKEVLERWTCIYSSSIQYVNAATRQIKSSKTNVGEELWKFFCKYSLKCNLFGIGERVSKYRLVQNHPDVDLQDGASLLDWAEKDEC